MNQPSNHKVTHEARTFTTLGEAIAYLQQVQAKGVTPDDIIILTPPPKKKRVS